MFCIECGNKLNINSKFCSKCGAAINNFDSQLDEQANNVSSISRLSKDRVIEDNIDPKNYRIEGVDFKPENHITIFILGVVTFGIYYFFQLYRWIKAINSASKKDFFDPTLAIIISLLTLGLGAIYFDYQILTKASQISRATGGKDNPKRKSLKAPSSNIRETVLAAGIFLSILSFVVRTHLSMKIHSQQQIRIQLRNHREREGQLSCLVVSLQLPA